MKRLFLITILIIFVLSACTTPAPPASEPPASEPPASEPPAPALPAPALPASAASNTPLPTATSAPLPTSTPAPTDTPLPTATFTPTATPLPEVISSQNAAQLQLVGRYGNGSIVQTLWSPDAKQLLVLTTVHLKAFDPTSGSLLWETETGSPQTQMANASDGKSIITLSKDGGAKTWDAATGKVSKTAHEPQDSVDFVALSGSGNLMALTSSAKETTIWELNTGQKLGTFNGSAFPLGMNSILVSPDDSIVWRSGFDSQEKQQVQASEVNSGKFLYNLRGIDWYYVTELAVSPDSAKIAGVSRLALSSEVEYAFLVWNTATARQLSKTNFHEDIDAFAFIPGQDQAVVASGGGLSLVDLLKGESGSSFGSYKTAIISLAVSADGKQLSAASANGVVKIFDLSKLAETKEIKLDLSFAVAPYHMSGKNYVVRVERYVGIGADPKGKFIAVLKPDRTGIDLVDPASLAVVKTIGKSRVPLSTFALSPDGSTIAAVDDKNVILMYDTATGSQKSSIQTGQQNYIKKVGISPNNEQVASVSGGPLGELYLWDAKSGEKLHTLSGYNVMAFSPDGKTLVSDNVDFGIYVWDTTTGKKLASPAADWIIDLSYAPGGSTIAISGFEVHRKVIERENLITLLDTETNTMLPLKLFGHPAIIARVLYSPDGKLLASADLHGNIRLWNVETGEMIQEIREAAPAPLQLLFINDGRTLVLGSLDGTLLFYEAR